MIFVPDFDECAYNVDTCVTEESMCVNTSGGYWCDCLDGYANTSSTTCEGVLEYFFELTWMSNNFFESLEIFLPRFVGITCNTLTLTKKLM